MAGILRQLFAVRIEIPGTVVGLTVIHWDCWNFKTWSQRSDSAMQDKDIKYHNNESISLTNAFEIYRIWDIVKRLEFEFKL